ncbi:efflux transporter outer membrane subunit [Derxia lacustris]|uniref:efflux transporter outer membrane subunit n=1 Tax=Derxia lacustris TaxID=764842 RepID=UPI000A17463E|nr:efflux transporter outer membrane subunit [Derxia lacustris]
MNLEYGFEATRPAGRRRVNGLLLVAMSAALAACAVGPDYKTPATPVATLVNATGTEASPLTAAANAPATATTDPLYLSAEPESAWWRQFDDPVLGRLVDRALGANLDLRIAVDRVQQARAAFTEAELDKLPHVPLTTNYRHTREQFPGFGTRRVDIESYKVGFDASWEIDLFGRVQRAAEAAGAEVEVAQATLRDAQVSVAAEVARNYFELRGAQARLDVARRNLANQAEVLRLTEVRRELGRGGELDAQQARARYKETEATLPQLDSATRRAAYRIAVLLGERPGALDAELAPVATPAYARALPIGDAAELLRRRPDVRAAERRLAAATARVGVATADLFPRLSFSGFVGFLSGDLGSLFRSGGGRDARAWEIGPSLSWSALDLGTTRARLRASKSNADVALAEYERSVLLALEDTENALAGYARQQQALRTVGEQVAAARRAAELAQVRYKEGGTDFLTLLEAQRGQLAAEDALARGEAEVNTGVVAIYKALGGVGVPVLPVVASAAQ